MRCASSVRGGLTGFEVSESMLHTGDLEAMGVVG